MSAHLAASAAPVSWLQLCSLQRGCGPSNALHKAGAIKVAQPSTAIPRIATKVTMSGDSSSEDLARRPRAFVVWLADMARTSTPREPTGSHKIVAAHGFDESG
jgi:hypothetical protein